MRCDPSGAGPLFCRRELRFPTFSVGGNSDSRPPIPDLLKRYLHPRCRGFRTTPLSEPGFMGFKDLQDRVSCPDRRVGVFAWAFLQHLCEFAFKGQELLVSVRSRESEFPPTGSRVAAGEVCNLAHR